jgi:glutamine phosphoribosylpyrophosphate amidotransferase
MKSFLLVLICTAMIVGSSDGQTQQSQTGQDAMEHRGNQGMGFDQQKTTHHFLLRKDGGAIQVTAKSTSDKESLDEIRMHLQHIRRAFQSGEFNIPMFVHDQTPPGVPVMTKLKDQIHYKYEAVKDGGRVLISSKNPEAISAVHDFLKFQITEHKTGDPLQ